eukprot:738748-Pelagomonas_calceolata.AAC.1
MDEALYAAHTETGDHSSFNSVCLAAIPRALSHHGLCHRYVSGCHTMGSVITICLEALEMALRLVLSIPLPDILAFRKLSRAYFTLLEVLAHNHTGTVAAQ